MVTWYITQLIHLFNLYDLQGILPFVFSLMGKWMHVHKTKFEKKTVLWGAIMWSEMGKQNLQAKNVY